MKFHIINFAPINQKMSFVFLAKDLILPTQYPQHPTIVGGHGPSRAVSGIQSRINGTSENFGENEFSISRKVVFSLFNDSWNDVSKVPRILSTNYEHMSESNLRVNAKLGVHV